MSTVEFLGVVETEDFIDGPALATLVNLETGTEHNNQNGWLHYILDGKELYVSMKPLRRGISWDTLHELGLVFGEKTIELNDSTFKVRLLKGISGPPRMMGGSYDPKWARDSEWNLLMYPVHWGHHIDLNNNVAQQVGEYVNDEFLGLSDYDLGVHHRISEGTRTWCQEQYKGLSIQRGMFGVSYCTKYAPSQVRDSFGWRPVLEKVEDNS